MSEITEQLQQQPKPKLIETSSDDGFGPGLESGSDDGSGFGSGSEANFDCEKHDFEYVREYKECRICNKREEYIDDPCETHIHNWRTGQFEHKPKMSVCILCGKTNYNFEFIENKSATDFFKYSGSCSLQKREDEPLKIKQPFPKIKNKKSTVAVFAKSSKDNNDVGQVLYSELFETWKRENPGRLSFLRK
jgi:hypothetical protein